MPPLDIVDDSQDEIDDDGKSQFDDEDALIVVDVLSVAVFLEGSGKHHEFNLNYH